MGSEFCRHSVPLSFNRSIDRAILKPIWEVIYFHRTRYHCNRVIFILLITICPDGVLKARDSYIIGCTSKYTKKLQSYQWWADNFVFNPWPKIGTHVIQFETFFTWCLSKLFLRHLFAWSRFMTTSFPISSLSLILIDTVITLFVTKLSHQGIENPKYNK